MNNFRGDLYNTSAKKEPLVQGQTIAGMDPSMLLLDETMMIDVWDKPICDLFTSKNDPEFVGMCDEAVVTSTCTDKAMYCNSVTEGDKILVEEMVALQIAHGMLGFMDGPAGILKQESTFGEVRFSPENR